MNRDSLYELSGFGSPFMSQTTDLPALAKMCLSQQYRLPRRWAALASGEEDFITRVLADTARLQGWLRDARQPDAEALQQWCQNEPPVWVCKSALFLLQRMPSQPLPEDDEEILAWLWVWAQIDDDGQFPAHLKSLLAPRWPEVRAAWKTWQGQQVLVRG